MPLFIVQFIKLMNCTINRGYFIHISVYLKWLRNSFNNRGIGINANIGIIIDIVIDKYLIKFKLKSRACLNSLQS